MSEQSIDFKPPTIEDLERRKREILEEVITKTIPELTSKDKELGRKLAKDTLEDIRFGNNPDLEGKFWEIIKQCGIDL